MSTAMSPNAAFSSYKALESWKCAVGWDELYNLVLILITLLKPPRAAGRPGAQGASRHEGGRGREVDWTAFLHMAGQSGTWRDSFSIYLKANHFPGPQELKCLLNRDDIKL